MARKKPCEFCDHDDFGPPTELPNAHVYLELYPDNGYIAFSVDSFDDNHEQNGEEQWTIPMNYCPVCGRRCF